MDDVLAVLPHALHVAAWWVAVAVLVAAAFVAVGAFLTALYFEYPQGFRGLIVLAVVVALLKFVFGCPPAHSATLRWTAPSTAPPRSALPQGGSHE